MYHPIVKEQVLPGQLEELQTNPHPTETQFQSQALILRKNWAENARMNFEGYKEDLASATAGWT